MSHSKQKCDCAACNRMRERETSTTHAELLADVDALYAALRNSREFADETFEWAGRQAAGRNQLGQRIALIVRHAVAAQVHLEVLVTEFARQFDLTDEELDAFFYTCKLAYFCANSVVDRCSFDELLVAWRRGVQAAHEVAEAQQRIEAVVVCALEACRPPADPKDVN